MFPIRGVPQWAQVLEEVLPLTQFLRAVRAIILKGNGRLEILAPSLAGCAIREGGIPSNLRTYRRTPG